MCNLDVSSAFVRKFTRIVLNESWRLRPDTILSILVHNEAAIQEKQGSIQNWFPSPFLPDGAVCMFIFSWTIVAKELWPGKCYYNINTSTSAGTDRTLKESSFNKYLKLMYLTMPINISVLLRLKRESVPVIF